MVGASQMIVRSGMTNIGAIIAEKRQSAKWIPKGVPFVSSVKTNWRKLGGAMIQGIETFAGFLVILMAVLPLAWIFYAVLAHLVVPAIRDLGRPEAGPGDAEGGRWLE